MDVSIAGLRCSDWIELWNECHTAGFGGPMRMCWPDGKSLLEQPGITVKMFGMITSQSVKSEEGRRSVKTG